MVLENGRFSKTSNTIVLVDGDIKLHPARFNNTYAHWLNNIRDWNISRQLWWGQQIPAYFYGDGKEDFVAEYRRNILVLAKSKLLTTHLQKI
jgi:valyl-tRNA synthetase